LRSTLNVLMHGLEALTALHRITNDSTVLLRLLELLDILCSRLAREQGLLYEAYLPGAAGEPWQPAPGQVVLYGEWGHTQALAAMLLLLWYGQPAAKKSCRHVCNSTAAATAAVAAMGS
jgi:mannose/cellobiose epimerase-like protein (N-acyl-D-glucosamine 2-epimerase family)